MPDNEVKVSRDAHGFFSGQSGAGWTVKELCDHSFTMLCDDGAEITNFLAAQTAQGDIVFTGWCA